MPPLPGSAFVSKTEPHVACSGLELSSEKLELGVGAVRVECGIVEDLDI